jgi:hypothetical protein
MSNGTPLSVMKQEVVACRGYVDCNPLCHQWEASGAHDFNDKDSTS